jgi:hypothetical protein
MYIVWDVLLRGCAVLLREKKDPNIFIFRVKESS